MSVNVFKYVENEPPTYILPVHKSSYRHKKIVNLLLLTDGENSHYVLIKSMAAFLKVKTAYGKSGHACDLCFRVFYSLITYMKHIDFCRTGEPTVEMPDDPVLKFKNFKYRMPNPITIYADFEAYKCKVNEEITESTKLLCEQKPSGYGYTVVSPYTQFCKPTVIYRGTDAADVFLQNILAECYEVESVLSEVKPMEFTEEDSESFSNSDNCSIFEGRLYWETQNICRDHCHITGKFRGAAHSYCNIMMQQQKKVIVYFHNAKGYDNHFLIKSLAANPGIGEIDVLGQTSEKYTRISTKHFVVHDSMSHLVGSLDSLSSSLRQRGDNGFQLIRQEFSDDLKFQCVIRKLVYPYDYIDSFEKFAEAIPCKEAFYNKLSEEELSDDEYNRLLRTCEIFKIKTLGQLHDLYLQIDVLILACVFEDYRRLGLEMFGLDPCYYVSSPSYSFDAMLCTTKVELELLTDKEMYNFFEKGKCYTN